ncbi:MAG: Dyp-type peroxidase [Deltaproteobacteria bacterium]|nr:Dyp-type peroxidase [Deltaproteobacteria bacterium]
MSNIQPGILAPVPSLARYLVFSSVPSADPGEALSRLGREADGETVIVGIGASVAAQMGKPIAALHAFPSYSVAGFDVPATPAALWCWLRGEDRGDLIHRTRRLSRALSPAFVLDRTIDAFRYGAGRDLTGYEDGTENPAGDAAVEAAAVCGLGDAMDGSTLVAVQQWVHDLDRFEAMSPVAQDHAIGRRKSDNEELTDAPPSAHIRRTAQESFEPPAFVLRRSMPWADDCAQGLVYVAFGASLAPFEALLARMVGAEDGIVDALFTFTRPVSGSYFWCPPMRAGKLDFRALGA